MDCSSGSRLSSIPSIHHRYLISTPTLQPLALSALIIGSLITFREQLTEAMPLVHFYPLHYFPAMFHMVKSMMVAQLPWTKIILLRATVYL